MYGDKAIELIKELDRSRGILPAYNEELIRQILAEMKYLVQQNHVDVRQAKDEEDPDTALARISPTIEFRHHCMERDKRCILAYLNNRLMRLKELRWEVGSVLPNSVRINLSETEVQWIQSYNQLLAGYMRSIGGVNLLQYMRPPKALYIEVRCLKDYGEFETRDGTIVLLKKNTQHSLPRSDCEALIRQGVLQHVD